MMNEEACEDVPEGPDNPLGGQSQHIKFEDNARLTRSAVGDRTGRPRSRSNSQSQSRRRSLSRGPESQTFSPYGELQIEYRTLSIHASEARHVADNTSDLKVTKDKEHDGDYFGSLEYHELAIDQVCQRFNVNPDQGLSHDMASVRLRAMGQTLFQ